MRIVQATYGVFHSFELAHQLQEHGYLRTIYSTWPWRRLKREGLPREMVKPFPWVGLPDYLLGRTRFYPGTVSSAMKHANALAFDRFVEWTIPECEVLIAISGAGLRAGKLVRERGGKYVCDRGSTHQRHMDEVLADEFRRWGLPVRKADAWVTEREEACYDAADAITVPSTAALRSFIAKGVPAGKMAVIPYGVRLDRFRKIAEPPSDSFEVLFAAQVSLRKGVPYLLKAFAQVLHPRKRLTIAGTVIAHIRPLLEMLPKDSVVFAGPVTQAELVERMSRSHVLVMPSVEEGIALVQAQAMACGCPVIATEATGAEDLFTDGVEGFIVPSRDVSALTLRMQQVADDPALRESLAAAGLLRVRAMGGWNTYGAEWGRLLHTLVG